MHANGAPLPGSRKSLCINDDVRHLRGGAGRVNEACLDLQQASRKARAAARAEARADANGLPAAAAAAARAAVGGGIEAVAAAVAAAAADAKRKKEKGDDDGGKGCPHLRPDGDGTTRVRDEILGAPLEIEELVGVGRREGACPYYAARSAVNEAHVVLLPYQARAGCTRVPSTPIRPAYPRPCPYAHLPIPPRTRRCCTRGRATPSA